MQTMSGAQLLLNYYDPVSKGFKYRPISQENSVFSKIKDAGCPVQEASKYPMNREGDLIVVPIDDSNYEHRAVYNASPSAPIPNDLDSNLKMPNANSLDSVSKSPCHSPILESPTPELSATVRDPLDAGSTGCPANRRSSRSRPRVEVFSSSESMATR